LTILRRQAAFDLLTAATKAQQAVIPVPAMELRKWLAIAARALVQVGVSQSHAATAFDACDCLCSSAVTNSS
jgi:hypothetical protein